MTPSKSREAIAACASAACSTIERTRCCTAVRRIGVGANAGGSTTASAVGDEARHRGSRPLVVFWLWLATHRLAHLMG
jgi:hypothetical protein